MSQPSHRDDAGPAAAATSDDDRDQVGCRGQASHETSGHDTGDQEYAGRLQRLHRTWAALPYEAAADRAPALLAALRRLAAATGDDPQLVPELGPPGVLDVAAVLLADLAPGERDRIPGLLAELEQLAAADPPEGR